METRILVVTKAKGSSPFNPIPLIKISGQWLHQYGFQLKKLIAVQYCNSRIDLELHSSEVDLTHIKSKSGFIRIGRSSKYKDKVWLQIAVKGYWLNNIGFPIGTVVAIYADHEKISVYPVNVRQQEGF